MKDETLLTTVPLDGCEGELAKWAEVLVELGLQDFYGVYVRDDAGVKGIFIAERP